MRTRTAVNDWIGGIAFFVGSIVLASSSLAYDWSTALSLAPGVKRTQGSTSGGWLINVVQVDTSVPGVNFYTTPRAPGWVDGTTETVGQGTRNFVSASHVTGGKNLLVAANGDFYNPLGGSTHNLEGVAVSDGVLVSSARYLAPGTGYPAFLVDNQGHASINTSLNNAFDLAPIRTAIGGHQMCLVNGTPPADNSFQNYAYPRTGIGLSQDSRYVYMMTIDGSESPDQGAHISLLGAWLQSYGAYNGILLDGGGSETMAWWNPSTQSAQLLNTPALGSERAVANNLGVYYVPEPCALALLGTGAICFGFYVWRRRKYAV